MTQTIKLIGVPQSPYSRKLRAALRYRRIPFQWVRMGSPESHGYPATKIPGMMPVLWFSHEDPEQDISMLDSTFQLKHLETTFEERSLYPEDSVVNFFSSLLEDFADEWLTKCMFHYRWHKTADIKKAGTILPLEVKWDQTDEAVETLADIFSQRQIERLWVVGSNPTTVDTIENSYVDTLKALNDIFMAQPFLLGSRASAADFAFMGQLACLTHFDPTPSQVALDVTPRIFAWVECVEDLSGDSIPDNAWTSRDDILMTLSPLLKIIGSTYIPFLLANANALLNGLDKTICHINGVQWEQKAFPYQGKCLHWLRESFAELNAEEQRLVKSILVETGCVGLIK